MARSAAVDLTWRGVIEISTVATRHNELAEHVRTGETIRLTLDAVERIDTAGWQLLLVSARELAQHEAQLQLIGLSSELQSEATQLGIMPTLAPLLATFEA